MVNVASVILLRGECFAVHPVCDSGEDSEGLEGNTGKESENKNTVLKMITKEQIEQAAKEWARKMSNAPDKDTPDWIECDFRGGANWAIAQCPYSKDDIISFADYIFQNHQAYGFMEKSYIELLKLWEEQK